MNRKARGLFLDLCDVVLWWDFGRLVAWACYAVLREKLWGGEESGRKTTLMVNAALMYEGTGKMGNEVQVIEI